MYIFLLYHDLIQCEYISIAIDDSMQKNIQWKNIILRCGVFSDAVDYIHGPLPMCDVFLVFVPLHLSLFICPFSIDFSVQGSPFKNYSLVIDRGTVLTT